MSYANTLHFIRYSVNHSANSPCVHFMSSITRVPFVDSVNSINFISVPWEKDPITLVEKYPSIKNNCGNGKCTINDGDCLCSIVVSETPAYNSNPSRVAVLSLKVGAFNPSTFSDSTESYTLHESSNDEVKIYVLSSGNIGRISTIFEVKNEFGEIAYFKNLVSTITLGRTYSLRNPPSFINLARVELRDAEYEGKKCVHLNCYIFIEKIILIIIGMPL